MASGTSVLRVILEMVTGKYVAGAKTAATETGKLSGAVQNAGVAAGKLQAAFVGVAGVLGSAKILKDLAQMAADDAKQQAVLAQTLRNTTGATEEQVAANEKWIESYTRASGIADDKLRPALGVLAIAGRSVEQSQRDMALAADIATARNLDLQTVTVAMSKAAGGQTTALRRLGIATTDASGAALTYDDILKNAAATMGGSATKAAMSLGGQLERQKVQWEETKESIGAKVLPQLNRLGDAFALLVADISGVNEGATQATVTLNEMVRQGIDPTGNAVATLVTVLAEAAQKASITAGPFSALGEIGGDLTGQVDQLVTSLSATGDQLRDARTAILANGEAWGYTEAQVQDVAGALEYAIRKQDIATKYTKDGTAAQKDYATAVRDSRAALDEAADPAIAYINSLQRLRDSQERYNDAVDEFGPRSREALDAGLDLAKASSDLDSAQREYVEGGSRMAMDAFKERLRLAGLEEDQIRAIIGALGELSSASANFANKGGPFGGGGSAKSQSISGKFDHGGIVPGPKGSPQLIVAHGGETILPTHKTSIPTIIPNTMSGGSGGVTINQTFQRVDGDHVDRDIQKGVILSGLSRLVETR